MGKYDYVVVGSGLFGAIFAHEMHQRGRKVLMLERRSHIGGNIYTADVRGIQVHRYGPHIFHTNKREVWEYVNRFTPFRQFVYSPVANYRGRLYNLPFNMHTFYTMWGVKTPEEAARKIKEQRAEYAGVVPKNLEEQALKLVGRDIYEKLIREYTEKQWGRNCEELPSFIIKRLPVRLTFDNNYFNDLYQGIPEYGYTDLIEKLLEGIEVRINTDFLSRQAEFKCLGKKIVFTGRVDEYFSEKLGRLSYRSLRFEEELLEQTANYQGVAVVNYTSKDVPYTRITEHKHFLRGSEVPWTVISREYPQEWLEGREPYYPVNDERNMLLYKEYEQLVHKEENVIFGGRLGTYQYLNMDQVIEQALAAVNREMEAEL